MSKKKGKLTKVETFYIDNNSNKDVSELAKDLNRTESTIKKHIDATKDTDHTTEVKDGTSPITLIIFVGSPPSLVIALAEIISGTIVP